MVAFNSLVPRSTNRIPAPKCPVCGAATAKVLWTIGSAESAQHCILREVDPERHERLRNCIRRLWQTETCDAMECEVCGFGFVNPYVAGDAEFYDLAYPRAGYPEDRWEYGRTLTALASNAQEWADAEVLEIGAGVGNFLARLPIAGERVVGAEYSRGGRAALAAAGYQTYPGDIREDAFCRRYTGRFGLVFLFQVMEHLDGLDSFFDCLRLVTKPGARIFISVPDTRRTSWTEQHGGLLDMPPGHIGRWTPTALAALAKRVKFEVVCIESRPWTLGEFIKSDTYCAYARRMHQSGSLPNRLHRLPRGKPRVALETAFAACLALTRLRHLPSALRERSGDTLWVELKREA
jgi:SAM-dependent methyltransferase